MSAPTIARPPAGIRCPNCGKRILEALQGRALIYCRGCKQMVEIAVYPK